ncbi:trehalose-phosphatase [Halosimplex carlsbadense 2-9-1]|uniref:Trehalose 6-phosphate phosphatase n=1 Tax=Halosimplex carlsbadense 2-9-1 TaxID=797114 RepID=M0CUE5_9EURY|nr:trehalose-phosphatase [Halosimplex carlsbadense]ELZ26870.1 trehalose-phosphatase [Halosimplex carlsbadense 2-9-1]
MQTTDALPLWLARETVADRLATAPGVVCCLDFDGVLAPIVDDPDAAAMPPALRERVVALRDRDSVRVAVVSGRELADLRDRIAVDGIAYAGNHGLERRVDDRRSVAPDARESRDAVSRVCDRLGDRLAHVPGVEIEDKGLTATVHVRGVPDDRTPEVERVVRDTVEETTADGPAMEIRDGKAIREVRPAVEWDKGRAVEQLAEAAPDGWLPLYVGDDVTDEDAFEALRERGDGLGVLVGERETAADYRIERQRDVRELLDLVVDAQGQ